MNHNGPSSAVYGTIGKRQGWCANILILLKVLLRSVYEQLRFGPLLNLYCKIARWPIIWQARHFLLWANLGKQLANVVPTILCHLGQRHGIGRHGIFKDLSMSNSQSLYDLKNRKTLGELKSQNKIQFSESLSVVFYYSENLTKMLASMAYPGRCFNSKENCLTSEKLTKIPWKFYVFSTENDLIFKKFCIQSMYK